VWHGVALLAVAAGCGGSAADPVPLAELSASTREAVCEWAVRCRHVPDRPTCDRVYDPKPYDTRRAQDAVAAGRLAYDPGAGGECLAQAAGAHCFVVPYSQPVCRQMFTGLVDEGGACTSHFECPRGARCEEAVCEGQCCLGACGAAGTVPEPPERAAVGERCATHFDCVDEAYCETSGVCVLSPEREGERCLFGCGPGDLFCDLETLTCRAYASRGEPCDPEGQAAPPCNAAWSFCDGVCRDRPGAGDPCGDDRVCVPVSFCHPERGECEPRGGPGAPCAASGECEVACVVDACVGYETCET
jgi:hypothetical protein